jgi:hypothetical protein
MAAIHGMKEAVELLLAHPKMNVSDPGYGFKYAYAFARKKGFHECIELLKPKTDEIERPTDPAANKQIKKKSAKSRLWQRLRKWIGRTNHQ